MPTPLETLLAKLTVAETAQAVVNEALADARAAAQAVVAASKPTPQPDPPVVGKTYIELGKDKLQAGKAYDVKPGTYNLYGIKPPDGCTLRGEGVTIDVPDVRDPTKSDRKLAWKAFEVGGTDGVTIDGFTFKCLPWQVGVQGSGVKNLTLANLGCVDLSGTIAQVSGDPKRGVGFSDGVKLRGIWRGMSEKYCFYGDMIRGLVIEDLTLPSVTYETSLRLMEGIDGVRIRNLTIDERAGIQYFRDHPTLHTKSPMAFRIHAVSGVDAEDVTIFGDMGDGPMTKRDGGDTDTDPVERARKLAWRADDQKWRNLTVSGFLELNPGLSRAFFDVGSVGRLTVTEHQYPEAKYLQPGDTPRPEPEATFTRFAFGEVNVGPIFDKVKFGEGCTVQGKPLA